jgi:Na+-driven multidrug efflux pump
MLEKLADFFIDSTYGLFRQYQRKSAQMLKIRAAAGYVQAVKAFRQQCLYLALIIFCLVMLAGALIIAPWMLILIAPWNTQTKVIAALILEALYIGVPASVLFYFVSEKRWLKSSGAEKILQDVMKGGN